MSESSYQLSVPMDTSDEKLIVDLAAILPDVLVKRFHYPAEQARALAPSLARAMVMRARECSQLKLPDDPAKKLLDVAPTWEQCEQLRQDLDAVIRIRYVDPAAIHSHRPPMLRQAAGRLWLLIGGGKTPDTSGPDVVVGVRG
jgi:hypothetical protein